MSYSLSRRVFLASSLLLVSAPALGAAVDPGRRRRAIAARQLRLSQRIMMAGFTAAAGVDAQAHIEIMREAGEDFGLLLAALADGDPALDLAAESAPDAAAAIAAATGAWRPMSDRIAEVDGPRDLRRSFVSALADLDEALSVRAAAIVAAVETAHGRDAEGAARAVGLARTQSLRSQTMAKDAALITLGRERAKHARRLEETVALFEKDLKTLRLGDSERRVAAPGPAAAAKLEEAEGIWGELGVVLQDVALAGQAAELDLQVVADLRDPLGETFEGAIALYQDV